MDSFKAVDQVALSALFENNALHSGIERGEKCPILQIGGEQNHKSLVTLSAQRLEDFYPGALRHANVEDRDCRVVSGNCGQCVRPRSHCCNHLESRAFKHALNATAEERMVVGENDGHRHALSLGMVIYRRAPLGPWRASSFPPSAATRSEIERGWKGLLEPAAGRPWPSSTISS